MGNPKQIELDRPIYPAWVIYQKAIFDNGSGNCSGSGNGSGCGRGSGNVSGSGGSGGGSGRSSGSGCGRGSGNVSGSGGGGGGCGGGSGSGLWWWKCWWSWSLIVVEVTSWPAPLDF